MASPLTVYSPDTDGRVYGGATSYADARTMASDTYETTVVRTGQYYGAPYFYIFEALIKFDTSSIPDDATITSATLSGYLTADNSAIDFTVQARIHSWTAPLSSDDWVVPTDLDTLTLVATLATSGIGATGAYKAFTDVALPANINKTGTTYILLCSSRSIEPGDAVGATDEYITFNGGGAGPNAFKLVVTYTSGTPPTITTDAITNIAANTATGGGNITGLTDAITDKGVCWNTGGTPTIADSHTHD